MPKRQALGTEASVGMQVLWPVYKCAGAVTRLWRAVPHFAVGCHLDLDAAAEFIAHQGNPQGRRALACAAATELAAAAAARVDGGHAASAACRSCHAGGRRRVWVRQHRGARRQRLLRGRPRVGTGVVPLGRRCRARHAIPGGAVRARACGTCRACAATQRDLAGYSLCEVPLLMSARLCGVPGVRSGVWLCAPCCSCFSLRTPCQPGGRAHPHARGYLSRRSRGGLRAAAVVGGSPPGQRRRRRRQQRGQRRAAAHGAGPGVPLGRRGVGGQVVPQRGGRPAVRRRLPAQVPVLRGRLCLGKLACPHPAN